MGIVCASICLRVRLCTAEIRKIERNYRFQIRVLCIRFVVRSVCWRDRHLLRPRRGEWNGVATKCESTFSGASVLTDKETTGAMTTTKRRRSDAVSALIQIVFGHAYGNARVRRVRVRVLAFVRSCLLEDHPKPLLRPTPTRNAKPSPTNDVLLCDTSASVLFIQCVRSAVALRTRQHIPESNKNRIIIIIMYSGHPCNKNLILAAVLRQAVCHHGVHTF